MLAVFPAPAVVRRFDKKRAALTLLVLSMVGVFPMPLHLVGLMPPNHTFALLAILLVVAFIQNALTVMALVIASSMMADVVEDVAASSGQHSAGLLFAPKWPGAKVRRDWHLRRRPAFGPGSVPARRDPGSRRCGDPAESVVFVPCATGCGAIGIAFLSLYRIDRASHQRNLEKLRLAADDAG